MEFNSLTEMFKYLTNGYRYELKKVETKKGTQMRLKNPQIEEKINSQIKSKLKFKDILVKLKLGPIYNRTPHCWIMLSTAENTSGTTGRYIGISFNGDKQEVSTWIGYGRGKKKKSDLIIETKQYISQYMNIEERLQRNFEYTSNMAEAVIIIKTIKLTDMDDDTFIEDLEYLVGLYKTYENKYENSKELNKTQDIDEENIKYKIELEKINTEMIELIEKVGILAKELKELNSKII